VARTHVVNWLEGVLVDARFGVRSLWRLPTFTGVAVLTLAVAIGSVTAIFALLNWFLLRPVPGVTDADRLIVVRLERSPGEGTGIAEANIRDLAAAAPALTGLAAWQGGTSNFQARVDGIAPFVARGSIVQGDYFGLLGVHPRLGRWFAPDEARAVGPGDLVIVSERFWRKYLGATPDAIGRRISLNAQPFTVVGVAPEGFYGTERTSDADLWLPPASYPRLQRRPVDLAGRGRQASIYFELIGRLSPQATPAVAQSQLRTAMSRLVAADPAANGTFETNVPTVYAGLGLPVLAREPVSRTLTQLLWGVAVLLAMAIANFSNLLLVRGAARRMEGSLRQALGATRTRIVQQNVVEALIIVFLAGACGLGFAVALSRLFDGESLLGLPPIEEFALDFRVVAFAFAMSVIAGVASSMVSGVETSRISVWAGLRADASGRVGPWGRVLRSGFVSVQIAAALTMITAALLLGRTLSNLHSVPLGFDPANVHVFGYSAAPQGYDPAARQGLDQRLLSSIESTVGVESAALATALPMMTGLSYGVTADDAATKSSATAFEVTADYFDTVRLRLRSGQAFAEDGQLSAGQDQGVILSKSAVDVLFPGSDPIGRMVTIRLAGKPTQQQVLGVTEDARLRGHRNPPTAAVYLPIGAAVTSTRYLLVRTAMPAHEVRRVVADAMARIDANIPFLRVQSLDEIVSRPIAEERLLVVLLGACGAIASFLAAVGIYGLMAYTASLRRKEMGIRLAVGADRAGIAALMIRYSARLFALGGVLGLIGSYGAARLLAHRVFGFAPLNAEVAIGSFILVAAITLIATLVPALRMVRVNVTDALKSD
jgi:putative ABC transport system permease protein